MNRYQQTAHKLGSDITLTLVLTSRQNPDSIFHSLWERIDAFDQRFSRFKLDSELTLFNNQAGNATEVSYDFFRLLKSSEDYSQQSYDRYNPFVFGALQRAGYVASWPHPDAAVDAQLDMRERDIVQPAELMCWQEDDHYFAKIPRGTALDFGGIGKGYLLDELTEFLYEQGVTNFWLSLGGDVFASGSNLENKTWQIQVPDALEPARIVKAIVATHTQAVATSGVTKRRGKNHDTFWHHLIDPATGRPAESEFLAVTVAADNGAAADVAAKSLLIGGRSEFEQIARDFSIRYAIGQTLSGDSIEYKRSKL